LAHGCYWSIEKSKERLGYEPVADQDAAIKQSMQWAMAEYWDKGGVERL